MAGSAQERIHRLPLMRSKLFVPGSRPELFDKAWRSEADALSFDLEDAVTESRKVEARELVRKHLADVGSSHAKSVIVRVNPVTSEHFKPDVEAVVQDGLDVVNLPKVETAEEILAAVALIERSESERGMATAGIGILVNIETPRGLRNAAALASASDRVTGLQLGFGDLLEPLGIKRREETLLPIRLAVRLAAAEAGVAAFDGAYVAVAKPEGFRAEAEAARAVGFAGKTCIHPSQIAIANAVFVPSTNEIERARKIVATADEMLGRGVGAFTIDGVMADGPFIERARAILKTADQLNADDRA
jgi:citrate lyase subunit beta/citryl-CoA lyase